MKKSSLVFLLILWLLQLGWAQVDEDQHDFLLTLPEIALVDIEPDNTVITLTLEEPEEAGSPVTIGKSGFDDTKWLNYSASLSPNSTNKKITAQITNGNVPNGLKLSVEFGGYTGFGNGTHGNPNGKIFLNSLAQTVITGIGACFTGDGDDNGHQIFFGLDIDQYDLLDVDDSGTVEVTFTITD